MHGRVWFPDGRPVEDEWHCWCYLWQSDIIERGNELYWIIIYVFQTIESVHLLDTSVLRPPFQSCCVGPTVHILIKLLEWGCMFACINNCCERFQIVFLAHLLRLMFHICCSKSTEFWFLGLDIWEDDKEHHKLFTGQNDDCRLKGKTKKKRQTLGSIIWGTSVLFSTLSYKFLPFESHWLSTFTNVYSLKCFLIVHMWRKWRNNP